MTARNSQLLVPIILFRFGLGLAITCAYLPFIPEWKFVQMIAVVALALMNLVTGIFVMRGIWLQTREMMTIECRAILTAAMGCLCGIFYLSVLFLSVMDMGGAPFSPTFHHAVRFEAYHTTIYVYDNSFMDAAIYVTMRRGRLPLMADIGFFDDCAPAEFEMKQNGDWIESEAFSLYLPTGEVKRKS